jgi:hypothetical protein
VPGPLFLRLTSTLVRALFGETLFEVRSFHFEFFGERFVQILCDLDGISRKRTIGETASAARRR